MKRIISFILIAAMLLSFAPSVFAADFSDLNSSHWAYTYVQTLVNDGTINGYADGTFRPEGTVTRAEFVKMIGNGPETRDAAFDDVSSGHWAYNYIMTSGLDPLKDNMFMPDTPITRGDVAELLWKRAGSPEGITAPPIVHRQSKNWDAASWVYTNGIMVGDDYIDLRLGDTLTRAEASALIVRSRNVNANTSKTKFMSSVNNELFEKVYNAFKLTDRPYDENATITNGELAMAAARLHTGADIPTYPNISATKSFEHEYAQPLNMLCRAYLGTENDNAAYADKNATVKEAIAAIMFAASYSAGVYIPHGTEAAYPGYVLSSNEKFDQQIKNAYGCGVWFDNLSEINLNKEVTMKELACLTLELNGFSGFYKSSQITSAKTSLINQKIRTNIATYPQNEDNYRIILASLPNNIYDTPFVSMAVAPMASHDFSNSFSYIFVTMLETWVKALSNAGYELEVSYYPGLVANNGNGYTIRAAVKFTNIPSNTRLGDLVNCVNAADADRIVNSGNVIYADIDTGKKLDGVIIGIENMVLSQIIK